MRITNERSGQDGIVFLSREDMEFLIYMTSDIWVTPESNRFKNEILHKAKLK
jgi:hypothetical protein